MPSPARSRLKDATESTPTLDDYRRPRGTATSFLGIGISTTVDEEARSRSGARAILNLRSQCRRPPSAPPASVVRPTRARKRPMVLYEDVDATRFAARACAGRDRRLASSSPRAAPAPAITLPSPSRRPAFTVGGRLLSVLAAIAPSWRPCSPRPAAPCGSGGRPRPLPCDEPPR